MQANHRSVGHFLPFAHLGEYFFMQFNKIIRDKIGVLELAVRVLSGLFWILLIFGFEDVASAVMTLAAALLHELGHCSALFILGAGGAPPRARLHGFGILTRRILSYREELFAASAGPLANLLVAAILAPLWRSDEVLLFIFFNLLTAVSNLLPIKGYDGYRIICSALSLIGRETAILFIDALSFGLASAAVLTSLCVIYFFDAGYWIFFVFFIFLLKEAKISLERRF